MKSLNLILIFAATLLIFFSNCEGYSTAVGIVKDKATDLPLDCVLCKVITGEMQIYTDSTGKYKVHNSIHSCVFGCKDITVEFSKKGYKTLDKTQESASGILYMEKQLDYIKPLLSVVCPKSNKASLAKDFLRQTIFAAFAATEKANAKTK